MEYPAEENGFRYIPFRIYQVGSNFFDSNNLWKPQTSYFLKQSSPKLLSLRRNWRVFLRAFQISFCWWQSDEWLLWNICLTLSWSSLFTEPVFAALPAPYHSSVTPQPALSSAVCRGPVQRDEEFDLSSAHILGFAVTALLLLPHWASDST